MKIFHTNLRFLLLVFQAAAFMFFSASNVNAAEAFVPSKNMLIGKPVLGKTMTPSEANMLEPVCVMILAAKQAKGGGGVWYENLKGNPVLDRPENLIAKGAVSFHHYCWAEVHMTRYYSSRNQNEKKAELLSAYNDYSFIISHPQWLPANWPYLPKMYVKQGGSAALMGKDQEAIGSFLKALEIDPKFELAYAALADFMAKKENKSKALEYLTEGLKHKPESKRLKRRYTELGGKQPYPVPYAKPESDKQEALSSPDNPATTPLPDAATTIDAPPEAPPANIQNEQIQQTPPPLESETLGTPDNPYCRFCP